MPKVKSKRSKVGKVQPFETMAVDTDETPVIEEVVEGESNHAIHKRHAAEWKKMKTQVVQLKQQRKACSKKQRDRKKELSKQIKTLISTLQEKHDEELRAIGVIPPKRSGDDMAMDDDE
jgi:hypothetical protein